MYEYEVGQPNYPLLIIASIIYLCILISILIDIFEDFVSSKPLLTEDFFDKCDALEIKIKENNMLGKAPPSNVYTVEMLVTVECKAYNKSDARTKAFDIVNFASQENDEHVSISSISIGKVTDNNVEYEELG